MKRFDTEIDQKNIDKVIEVIVKTSDYLHDQVSDHMPLIDVRRMRDKYERFFSCFKTYKAGSFMEYLYPEMDHSTSLTKDDWEILYKEVFNIVGLNSRHAVAMCYYDMCIWKIMNEFPEKFLHNPYDTLQSSFKSINSIEDEILYVRNQMFPGMIITKDPDVYYGMKPCYSEKVKERMKNDKDKGFYKGKFKFDTFPVSNTTATSCKAELTFYSPTYIDVNKYNTKVAYKITSMSFELKSVETISKMDFRVYCILMFKLYARFFMMNSKYITVSDDALKEDWFEILSSDYNKIKMG